MLVKSFESLVFSQLNVITDPLATHRSNISLHSAINNILYFILKHLDSPRSKLQPSIKLSQLSFKTLLLQQNIGSSNKKAQQRFFFLWQFPRQWPSHSPAFIDGFYALYTSVGAQTQLKGHQSDPLMSGCYFIHYSLLILHFMMRYFTFYITFTNFTIVVFGIKKRVTQ